MRSLSEVDLLEREVHCSHTSAVEVKNVWNLVSAAPYIFKLLLRLFSTSFAMENLEFYGDLQMSSFPILKKSFLSGCMILKANQLRLLSLPSSKLIYEP